MYTNIWRFDLINHLHADPCGTVALLLAITLVGVALSTLWSSLNYAIRLFGSGSCVRSMEYIETQRCPNSQIGKVHISVIDRLGSLITELR